MYSNIFIFHKKMSERKNIINKLIIEEKQKKSYNWKEM